jgi:hypothetical protein
MLEGHRVDDVDGTVGRVLAEEQTVDCFVGVFESMNDEFGVGEVIEAKHAPKAPWVRIWRGRVPARRNRHAALLV